MDFSYGLGSCCLFLISSWSLELICFRNQHFLTLMLFLSLLSPRLEVISMGIIFHQTKTLLYVKYTLPFKTSQRPCTELSRLLLGTGHMIRLKDRTRKSSIRNTTIPLPLHCHASHSPPHRGPDSPGRFP